MGGVPTARFGSLHTGLRVAGCVAGLARSGLAPLQQVAHAALPERGFINAKSPRLGTSPSVATSYQPSLARCAAKNKDAPWSW